MITNPNNKLIVLTLLKSKRLIFFKMLLYHVFLSSIHLVHTHSLELIILVIFEHSFSDLAQGV